MTKNSNILNTGLFSFLPHLSQFSLSIHGYKQENSQQPHQLVMAVSIVIFSSFDWWASRIYFFDVDFSLSFFFVICIDYCNLSGAASWRLFRSSATAKRCYNSNRNGLQERHPCLSVPHSKSWWYILKFYMASYLWEQPLSYVLPTSPDLHPDFYKRKTVRACYSVLSKLAPHTLHCYCNYYFSDCLFKIWAFNNWRHEIFTSLQD